MSIAEVTGIRRYIQLHAIPSAVGEGLAAVRGSRNSEWDGVALLWVDNEEAPLLGVPSHEGDSLIHRVNSVVMPGLAPTARRRPAARRGVPGFSSVSGTITGEAP